MKTCWIGTNPFRGKGERRVQRAAIERFSQCRRRAPNQRLLEPSSEPFAERIRLRPKFRPRANTNEIKFPSGAATPWSVKPKRAIEGTTVWLTTSWLLPLLALYDEQPNDHWTLKSVDGLGQNAKVLGIHRGSVLPPTQGLVVTLKAHGIHLDNGQRHRRVDPGETCRANRLETPRAHTRVGCAPLLRAGLPTVSIADAAAPLFSQTIRLILPGHASRAKVAEDGVRKSSFAGERAPLHLKRRRVNPLEIAANPVEGDPCRALLPLRHGPRGHSWDATEVQEGERRSAVRERPEGLYRIQCCMRFPTFPLQTPKIRPPPQVGDRPVAILPEADTGTDMPPPPGSLPGVGPGDASLQGPRQASFARIPQPIPPQRIDRAKGDPRPRNPNAGPRIEAWRFDFSQVRPHSGLDNLTPTPFALHNNPVAPDAAFRFREQLKPTDEEPALGDEGAKQ